MRRANTDPLEKSQAGARIKQLRTKAGLHQWQLAELIGSTQPSVHMYERGVLPKPKRLLQIARIGGTTVEWVMTGRHWENGSSEMTRIPEGVCEIAFELRDYIEQEREAFRMALEILSGAAEAIRKAQKEGVEELSIREIGQRLRDFARETRRATGTAVEIYDAACRARLRTGVDDTPPPDGRPDGKTGKYHSQEGQGPGEGPIRARSLEPVLGPLYRLDSSLLAIEEILKNRKLRREFEVVLTRLANKLESRRRRGGRR
jgi:transcriptional regulator with XRE-family HTH domain